jgi:hypothetical protein
MLKVLSSSFMACLAIGSSAAELFSPAPYIERANARVGIDYEIVKSASKDVSVGEFNLKRGTHKLFVKGREPGARMDQIFIGRLGEAPEKGTGTFIEAGRGVLVPPMKLDGNTLVGGDKAGSASYDFTVAEDGAYAIWGKASGPDSSSNSFFIVVDGGRELIFDVPINSNGKTQWTKVQSRGYDYYSYLSFWLSWGATSPLSGFRDDPKLHELALQLTGVWLDKLASSGVFPKGLWFMPELEAVRMWQEDARTSREDVAKLMEKFRPYIEKCNGQAKKEDGWYAHAPNIQLQSAVILRLASVMWKDVDPSASKEWATASERCLERAWRYKLPKGGFRYAWDSGMDAGYFGEDAEHLTRYYMLTKDEKVGAALKDMAEIAKNSSSYGQPILIGSPWWKHNFSSYNKDARVSALILALSKDPLYASFLELNRRRLFASPLNRMDDGLMSYYNMQVPEFSVPLAPIKDGGFMSEVENGPALRYGGLNVAMPWQPWCESTCGACHSTSDAVNSEVCSVILTALTSNIYKKKASSGFANYRESYSSAYSVIVDHDPEFRTVVCDKDFIASVTSFRPAALPIYSTDRNLSPWLRTDIYFADKNGFAGALELKALQDNDCLKVVLWARVSDEKKIEGSKIKLNGMVVDLENAYSGKISNLGKVWGYPGGMYPLELLEGVVKDAGTEGFKKDETFNTTVAVNAAGSAGLSVGNVEVRDGVKRVEINLAGKPHALLLFNAGDARRWPAEKFFGNNDGSELPAKSLTVLKGK